MILTAHFCCSLASLAFDRQSGFVPSPFSIFLTMLQRTSGGHENIAAIYTGGIGVGYQNRAVGRALVSGEWPVDGQVFEVPLCGILYLNVGSRLYRDALPASHSPLVTVSCKDAGARPCARRKRIHQEQNFTQRGRSDKYEELCAVSTTGELSQEEWADLRER
jgi:hypothetical protein